MRDAAGGGRWVLRAWVCINAQFSLVLETCIVRLAFFLYTEGAGLVACARSRAAREPRRPRRASGKGGGRDAARRLVSPRLAIAKWRRRQRPTPPAPHKDVGSGLCSAATYLWA